jgi:hypothetical protein
MGCVGSKPAPVVAVLDDSSAGLHGVATKEQTALRQLSEAEKLQATLRAGQVVSSGRLQFCTDDTQARTAPAKYDPAAQVWQAMAADARPSSHSFRNGSMPLV